MKAGIDYSYQIHLQGIVKEKHPNPSVQAFAKETVQFVFLELLC